MKHWKSGLNADRILCLKQVSHCSNRDHPVEGSQECEPCSFVRCSSTLNLTGSNGASSIWPAKTVKKNLCLTGWLVKRDVALFLQVSEQKLINTAAHSQVLHFVNAIYWLLTTDSEKGGMQFLLHPTVLHIQLSLKCFTNRVPLQMCSSQIHFIFLMIQHSFTK